MAVYGIAENKCLKEVVAKDNFLVLEGVVPLAPRQGAFGYVPIKNLGAAYADWNPDEWVVVGRMIRFTDDNPHKWFAPYYSGNPSEFEKNVNPTVHLGTKQEGEVRIGIYNPYNEEKTFSYKVVLMKVK